MYAIILTGGKQVKAEIGQVIYTEKIEGEKDQEVSFDKVLFIDGEKVLVGKPFVEGATVKATIVPEIVKQGREPKIRVLRYKAKSNLRVARGHRQPYTALKIEAINF